MKQRNQASLYVKGRKYLAACALALSSGPAISQEMTAGSILTHMDANQQSAYLAGLIEGLAFARYDRDGNTDGMACIYTWFYSGIEAQRRINAAFEHFADHYPGAVMAVLVEQECGS